MTPDERDEEQTGDAAAQRSRLAKAIARLVMGLYRARHPEAGRPEAARRRAA